MRRDDKRKITVEDLIRLKRAERPPAEFWQRFDSEMRAKQLSAIVEPKPWWTGFHRRVFVAVARNPFPLGAAAALALTYAGIRFTSESGETAHRVQVAVAVQRPVAVVPAPVGMSVAAKASQAVQGVGVVSHEVPSPSAPVAETAAPHLVSRPAVELSVDSSQKSPFGDGFAVTMANFKETAPVASQRSVFGSDSDFEAPAAQVRQAASDPLAKLDPAAERRARLLAPALPSGSRVLANDWIRDRTASDDRIYESMDRASSDRGLTGIRF
jgi:hypothetical protein